jgi:hypothetical protein
VVPEIVQRLFSLPRPQEGGSSFEYLLTRAGDAVVIELARVSDGNYDALAEAEQAQMQGQVSGEFSGLINSEFESGLRTRAEVSTVL